MEPMTMTQDMSASVGSIAKALAGAQAKITTADKDRANSHFGAKYATLASVQAACQGPLSEAGIAVVQPASTEFHDGACLVTVRTMLIHESGEFLGMSVTVQARDGGPQSVGSCITYGRRYGLASMAGVAPDDDDDGNAGQPVEGSRVASRPQQANGKPKTIANKFAGACYDCGGPVAEKAGVAEQINGKWETRHDAKGSCLGAKPAAKSEPAEPPTTETAKAVTNTQEGTCTYCAGNVEIGKGWERGDLVIHFACAKAKKAERDRQPEPVGAGKGAD